MIDPPDSVFLFRAVWRDQDFDGDTLIASKVFPSDDLKSPRYISVDREDLYVVSEARERLQEQQKNAVAKGNNSRKSPAVARLPCIEVRKLRFEQEDRLILEVRPETDGFHNSHCAIANVNTVAGKPSYNDIRRQLMLIVINSGVLDPFPDPN